MTIQLRGVIDVDALSDAFDALLKPTQSWPATLSKAPTAVGIVADDLLHSGICVIDGTAATNGSPSGNAELRLDQACPIASALILREGEARRRYTSITAWPMVITGPFSSTSCSPATPTRSLPVTPAR